MGDDEGTQSGSDTYPMQASAIKKNGYVVIKDRPCKVVETSTSKTGKHGHAKCNIVAIDIFTGRKYEDISPSTHPMMVPNVTRQEYLLTDVNEEGFCALMEEASGELKEDLKVPDDEVGQGLKAAFDKGQELIVAVLRAMGEERIVSFKENSK